MKDFFGYLMSLPIWAQILIVMVAVAIGIGGYFLSQVKLKTWKEFFGLKPKEENPVKNVKKDNKDLEIERLSKELQTYKVEDKITSLITHEVFYSIDHHLKMITNIDFNDDERNWSFRKIVDNKLRNIKESALYLLTLEDVHNVTDINKLPRMTLVKEIDDLIENTIKAYNIKSMNDFRLKFGLDKSGNELKSDCIPSITDNKYHCPKRVNGLKCCNNLGICIFEKIMNDPDKGFNFWHNQVIEKIKYNLDYYYKDMSISNVELLKLTLCEFSKGATTAAHDMNKAFILFNGDLTHLLNLYLQNKNN